MFPSKTSSSKKPPSLNKLVLTGTVWLASDIHLGPRTPATQQAFFAFLDRACAQADALLLCGDLFDAWIGDDVALSWPDPWLHAALEKFRDTAARIPLYIGGGNRDFLISHQLVDHIGAQLLPEQVCLATSSGDILVSHGDEYCTADAAFQRFRRIVRNPWVQKAFYTLSAQQRKRIADWARQRSRSGNQTKSYALMDVTQTAIAQTVEQTGITTIVHGHTHRPAVHRTELNGQTVTRYVLPDWDFDHAEPARGGWISISRAGIHLHNVQADSARLPELE